MLNTRKSTRQIEKVRTLVLDLMHRAILITQTTEHDIIFDYSGHVNNVSLCIYVGGYENCSDIVRVKVPENNGIDGIYLDDSIQTITKYFDLANAELDKLVAESKAA